MAASDRSTPSEVLFDFVIDKGRDLPAQERIRLYLAAAEMLCGVDEYAAMLRDLATQLQEVENGTLKLELIFRKDRL